MNSEFIPFSSKAQARTTPTVQSPSPVFAPVSDLGATHVQSPPCQPREVQVELKRDGDRISRIRVQCRCGEVIELDCEY